MPDETPVQDLWPDLRTVRMVDDLLQNRWLLDFIPDEFAIKKQFPDIDEALHRFEDANSKAVAKAGPYGVIDERELFRLLAHPGLFAHKATGRRHFVLDGIALAIGVLRLYYLKGAVLDVGCHIGTTTDILARLVPNKIVGIDPVGAAIDTARRLTSGLQNVELHRAMLPWETDAKFDLITCYDVLHHIPILRQARLINSLGSLIEDGGALIVSGPSLVDPEWLAMARPTFQTAHLGYVDCDVLGGFGGVPPSFSATGVALFRKGNTSLIPEDLKDLSSREWTDFQIYANAAGTLGREKTQAFERAMRTRQKAPRDLCETPPVG